MKLDGDICRVAKKSKRCYAAFSGDVAPALIVLGAEVEILGAEGQRRPPLPSFYRDDGMAWLTLAPDELLAAVHVPLDTRLEQRLRKGPRARRHRFPAGRRRRGPASRGRRDRRLRIACTGVSSRPLAVEGLPDLPVSRLTVR